MRNQTQTTKPMTSTTYLVRRGTATGIPYEHRENFDWRLVKAHSSADAEEQALKGHCPEPVHPRQVRAGRTSPFATRTALGSQLAVWRRIQWRFARTIECRHSENNGSGQPPAGVARSLKRVSF